MWLPQAALLLPLFIFCYYMYEWETDEANQVGSSCFSMHSIHFPKSRSCGASPNLLWRSLRELACVRTLLHFAI